ncbi:MAG: hypothetical protein MUP09_05705 [Thiovulaceae bacterium]|nr:hypothetical protein [Sulfurimonadaceae bacterium]
MGPDHPFECRRLLYTQIININQFDVFDNRLERFDDGGIIFIAVGVIDQGEFPPLQG